MKVLVTPLLDLSKDRVAAEVARALAGPEGTVVYLGDLGVKNLSRPVTQAEVALIRRTLRDEVGPEDTPGRDAGVVGCLCSGVSLLDGPPSDGLVLVAVTDHANLTWRSPLAGPNDDVVGPRFPDMTRVYAPEPVMQRLGAEGGIIVTPGVVAGVEDHIDLNAYERETVWVGHHSAVCSELVPIAILAAHMGLTVAAAVATWVP